MATWDEFAAADPELAAFGRDRLYKYDVALGLIATTRYSDGGPRVHPCCPFLADGRLYIAIPAASPKHRDLRKDPRYMLHAFPGDEDMEFSIRGRARLVTHDAERAVVAAACPFATGVKDDDFVFEFDIERADSTTWANWAKADTYPIRKKWFES
jgi:hypothetical protein